MKCNTSCLEVERLKVKKVLVLHRIVRYLEQVEEIDRVEMKRQKHLAMELRKMPDRTEMEYRKKMALALALGKVVDTEAQCFDMGMSRRDNLGRLLDLRSRPG